jgi:hypothetical protein
VYYSLGKWSLREMAHYDNTALEYFGSTLVCELTAELHRALGLQPGRDVIVVGDNSAASRDVGQSGIARAQVMRRLVARRAASTIIDSRDRFVHVHARRRFNEPSDRLSTGKVEQFKALIRELFGRQMYFQRLPKLPWNSRRLILC